MKNLTILLPFLFALDASATSSTSAPAVQKMVIADSTSTTSTSEPAVQKMVIADSTSITSASGSDVQDMVIANSSNSATTTTTTTTSTSTKKRKRLPEDNDPLEEERDEKAKSRKGLKTQHYENTLFIITKNKNGTIKGLDGGKVSGTPYSLATALRGDCTTFKDFVGAFKYLQQQRKNNTLQKKNRIPPYLSSYKTC